MDANDAFPVRSIANALVASNVLMVGLAMLVVHSLLFESFVSLRVWLAGMSRTRCDGTGSSV